MSTTEPETTITVEHVFLQPTVRPAHCNFCGAAHPPYFYRLEPMRREHETISALFCESCLDELEVALSALTAAKDAS